MKECCKDSGVDTTKNSAIKKWLNYIIYLILILIVGGALVIQFFS